MNRNHYVRKFLAFTIALCLCMGLGACSPSRGCAAEKPASNHLKSHPKAKCLSRYGNRATYVVRGKKYHVLKDAAGYDEVGYASWYGNKFQGRHTSSHESYNMYSMTAASRTLPIPTYVRVTNLSNDKSVVVKVNDRGPFKSSRLIDLSYAAAKKLGYTHKGTTKVRVTALDSDLEDVQLVENNATSDLPSVDETLNSHSSKHTVVTKKHRKVLS